MCSRVFSWAFALAVLGAPGSVAAQRTEAELLARIDSLQRELAEAGEAVANVSGQWSTERLEALRRSTTTFRVGPLRIVTLREQADLARELFETVWREDFHEIDGSPSLERSVFAFEWWRRQPAEVYWLPTMDDEDLVVRRVEVGTTWVPTRSSLRAYVRDAIWRALREDFPEGSPMRGWLRERPYLPDADAYRALATTATGASRACLAGDLEGCATTLRLSAPSRDQLAEWFTPEMRENMVRRAAQIWNARVDDNDPEVVACLDGGQVDRCDAVLARILWAEGVPTDEQVLVSAFWHAVEVGGEEAWARAIADPTSSPAEVMGRASGLAIDVVLADWRRALVEARPPVYAGLGRSALIASFWVLILAGFAMRSTRWRLA